MLDGILGNGKRDERAVQDPDSACKCLNLRGVDVAQAQLEEVPLKPIFAEHALDQSDLPVLSGRCVVNEVLQASPRRPSPLLKAIVGAHGGYGTFCRGRNMLSRRCCRRLRNSSASDTLLDQALARLLAQMIAMAASLIVQEEAKRSYNAIQPAWTLRNVAFAVLTSPRAPISRLIRVNLSGSHELNCTTVPEYASSFAARRASHEKLAVPCLSSLGCFSPCSPQSANPR